MKKRFLLTVFLVIIADQLLKLLILWNSGRIFKPFGFFQIKYTTNTGAAFGLLQDQTTALIWLSVIVIGVILFYYDKITKKNAVPVALILGGTIGNLIDRLAYGFVVDFIDFSFWPCFNIADAALTVGVLWLVFVIWKE